jgi:hypothetical protein
MGIGDLIISTAPILAKYIIEAIKNANLHKIVIHPISREESINQIIDAYQKEDLVLVLGAGISVPYKLPDWESLLQGLLLASISKDSNIEKDDVENNSMETSKEVAEDANKEALSGLFSKVFDISPLVAARYLRSQNNPKPSTKRDVKSNDRAFENQVRNLLYASLKKEENGHLYDSGLMKEIRQLCIAAGKRPNLDSIITYNFDDILEECLSRLNIDIPFKIIYDVGIQPEQGKLSIYHVHGYLPREGELDRRNRVIFSEDVYHEQYSDIYSWSNIVQINKFREKTCLFLGLSFSDPNMRRLLDIAQEQRGEESIQHFVIRKREDINDIIEALLEIFNKDQILKAKLKENKINLSKLITDLRRLKEEFEEQDSYSFGIGTIWVDEYDEIEEIVRRVRQMEYYQINKKA